MPGVCWTHNAPRPGIKDEEKRSNSSLETLIQNTRRYNTYKKATKKQTGMEVNLTDEQIELLYVGSCAYCLIPECHGIDRVDSNKGYTLENCVSACKICNFFKNDMTLEDFYEWVQRG